MSLVNFCSRSDLDDRFGQENITAWATMGGESGQAVLDRVTRAIGYATSYILSQLGPVSVTPDITRWATFLAGIRLRDGRGYDDAKDPFADARLMISNEISAAASGIRRQPGQIKPGVPTIF